MHKFFKISASLLSLLLCAAAFVIADPTPPQPTKLIIPPAVGLPRAPDVVRFDGNPFAPLVSSTFATSTQAGKNGTAPSALQNYRYCGTIAPDSVILAGATDDNAIRVVSLHDHLGALSISRIVNDGAAIVLNNGTMITLSDCGPTTQAQLQTSTETVPLVAQPTTTPPPFTPQTTFVPPTQTSPYGTLYGSPLPSPPAYPYLRPPAAQGAPTP